MLRFKLIHASKRYPCLHANLDQDRWRSVTSIQWRDISFTTSQTSSNWTVCSTDNSSKQQIKHQSSTLLTLCEGNPPVTLNSFRKGQSCGKKFPFHYVIITNSRICIEIREEGQHYSTFPLYISLCHVSHHPLGDNKWMLPGDWQNVWRTLTQFSSNFMDFGMENAHIEWWMVCNVLTVWCVHMFWMMIFLFERNSVHIFYLERYAHVSVPCLGEIRNITVYSIQQANGSNLFLCVYITSIYSDVFISDGYLADTVETKDSNVRTVSIIIRIYCIL